jgi:hypothetical protein
MILPLYLLAYASVVGTPSSPAPASKPVVVESKPIAIRNKNKSATLNAPQHALSPPEFVVTATLDANGKVKTTCDQKDDISIKNVGTLTWPKQ